jgi:hypothetical protein
VREVKEVNGINNKGAKKAPANLRVSANAEDLTLGGEVRLVWMINPHSAPLPAKGQTRKSGRGRSSTSSLCCPLPNRPVSSSASGQ